ncbi:DUF397 domain-containing protein [Streptomyces gobiensis]|uniref:DUF397 domain-containing protein n=1 Tax=Streptomyces gobiensis TaxID=2875706 RepID=UPI001E32EB8C|nr:DUF397 domain-containing protein [Streptomyces gobiensis]UGY91686.1 DUF397 domain-containing protein [Streptomyces gobiensis]
MNAIPDASILTAWRKSSYSDNGQNGCVEVVDDVPGAVPVRDSKRPHGPALVFPPSAWSSFVGGVKGGELSA